MTRLLNSINHRKCHRRQKETINKYDIEMKRLKAIEMRYALYTLMPYEKYKHL